MVRICSSAAHREARVVEGTSPSQLCSLQLEAFSDLRRGAYKNVDIFAAPSYTRAPAPWRAVPAANVYCGREPRPCAVVMEGAR